MKENTNLKKRIIPVILFSNYEVVKSLNFDDYRLFGNLEQTISVFNTRNVDEIIILDIDASKKNKDIDNTVLKILARESLMPLTYGGGLKNLQDIEECLKNGCDKVSINTEFLKNPRFIYESSKNFGSQCIVSSIDYKIVEGKFKIFSHSENKILDKDIFEYIKILQDSGTGEILLNSVDNDGKMLGYETSLIDKVCNIINVPIILSGGCGKPDHIFNIISKDISAFAMGSIFYFTKYSYSEIKNFLKEKNCNVR